MQYGIRMLRFTRFTLVEYVRSGHILVEVLASVAFFYVFFWRASVQRDYFFSLTGLFTLGLAFYTTSAIMGLGDRPQGYVLLARRLSRSGYLIGLYLAALLVVFAVYGVVCVGVVVLQRVEGLTFGGWVLSTVPLLLNVGLFAALLTLMTPIVLTPGLRLLVLALIALAFSGNLIGGETLTAMPVVLVRALDLLRTIFSVPLLPAFTGFELSVTGSYAGLAYLTPISQLLLLLSMLALAVYAFGKRDIIFGVG